MKKLMIALRALMSLPETMTRLAELEKSLADKADAKPLTEYDVGKLVGAEIDRVNAKIEDLEIPTKDDIRVWAGDELDDREDNYVKTDDFDPSSVVLTEDLACEPCDAASEERVSRLEESFNEKLDELEDRISSLECEDDDEDDGEGKGFDPEKMTAELRELTEKTADTIVKLKALNKAIGEALVEFVG